MAPHDQQPAFESLPSGLDIAHWFVDEMRHEENVGGDAWWLCREPHGSARMLAFVDYDVQEFWLLDIATEDTKDLLFVTNGLDGLSCEWWQHPTSTAGGASHWYPNGVRWLADQIIVHFEQQGRAK